MTFITNTTFGGETRRYDYSYDLLGRLEGADYSGVDLANGGVALAADFSTAYSYDLQGNILTLTRQGMIAPDLYGWIDDLTATLRGNRLIGLRDDAGDVLLESSLDLRGGDFGEDAFGYDRNGNQTRDMSRGVADVAYNVLNLPQRVEMEDGSAIAYTYSASGTKLTETVISPEGIRVVKRGYLGPFEIIYDSVTVPQGIRPPLVPRDTMIHFADGYLTMADTVFHAYIADYQGNITGVYNTRTAALEQFTDYYPYGMPHAMAVASGCGNRRKFGGKELTTDRGLNLYDFEARWMNSMLPHFTTQDQMAEKYYHISPHTFCAGDPINFTDPTGMDVYRINDRGELVERVECNDYDRIQLVDPNGYDAVDDDGDLIYIDFKYGTIEAQTTTEINSERSYDTYQIRGDENASRAFEFLSNNISVNPNDIEFSLIRTGKEGDKGLNFITTSHDDKMESGISRLFNSRLNKGYTIREFTHSHPNVDWASEKDKQTAFRMQHYNNITNGKTIKYFIYHVPSRTYIPYQP